MGVNKGARIKAIVTAVGVLSLAAFSIDGWYYIRNWIALGSPFIGGWSRSNGMPWWQDPGYRVIGDMFRFGEVLNHPIYAATEGFWDSIYSTFWTDGSLSGVMNFEARPPWNYELLAAGTLISVVPTLVIALGIGVALMKESPINFRISIFATAFYFSALLSYFITLPAYCAGKATYINGATPCFAVLFAAGVALLYKQKFLRFPIVAVLGCWAVSSYCGFFII